MESVGTPPWLNWEATLNANQTITRTAVAPSVDFITATENVVTFLLFADEYGCDCDGWGTVVTEAAERD